MGVAVAHSGGAEVASAGIGGMLNSDERDWPGRSSGGVNRGRVIVPIWPPQERAKVPAVLSTDRRPVVATRCTRTFRVHDYVLSSGQADRSDCSSGEDKVRSTPTPESHTRERLIREPKGEDANRGIFAVTDIQSADTCQNLIRSCRSDLNGITAQKT